MTITNSTVSGNSLTLSGDGGGVNNFGTLTVTNSTVAFNAANGLFGGRGGGINNVGTASVGNTIIAKNTAATSAPDFRGTLASQGYNLIGDATGANITGTTTGNQTGTSGNQIDPRLDPLANYGGTTPTHRLKLDSPAIDKGKNFATDPNNNNASVLTDQRGFTRPIDLPVANAQGGDSSDIGAFELQQSEFTADLSVTKTAAPNPVQPGGNLTYTITITNNSQTTAAPNVRLTDNLPANTTFQSARRTDSLVRRRRSARTARFSARAQIWRQTRRQCFRSPYRFRRRLRAAPQSQIPPR